MLHAETVFDWRTPRASAVGEVRDLINRLTRKRSLLELPKLVGKEEAESLEKAIEESSEERREARKREIEA